jgi:hypothetical protein
MLHPHSSRPCWARHPSAGASAWPQLFSGRERADVIDADWSVLLADGVAPGPYRSRNTPLAARAEPPAIGEVARARHRGPAHGHSCRFCTSQSRPQSVGMCRAASLTTADAGPLARTRFVHGPSGVIVFARGAFSAGEGLGRLFLTLPVGTEGQSI